MPPVKPTRLRTDVFISSTYDDLIEYRAAVTEAILSLGLFPSGMENWPLRDENAIQLCRRKIDEAEVFVGIYAYRYGWTPDGYDGKSITELEYDWATERKIPRLRFIMADTQPWPEKLKEKDAQPAMNVFKSRLKQEVVGFFTTPDDLKAQVIAALVPYVPKTNLRALEPYLRWLHEENKRSGLLRVLNPRDATVDAKSVTVDKVYTPLFTQSLIELRDEVLTKVVKSQTPRHSHDARTIRLSTMRAATEYKHLVLLGDPGTGKSTFLQFLTLGLTGHFLNSGSGWMNELQKQGWLQGERIPVIVILRDFAQDIPAGTTEAAATLLFDHIERQLARPRLEACFPALQEAFENGSALVLLDGLDEVPDARRELVRQTILKFIQRGHPANRYIVTCRILSYTNEAWKLPGMEEETIAPFVAGQIAQFVRAWYTALAELHEIDTATADRRAEELIVEMKNEQVGKIAQNPMLLTVMAIVHNHQGALPKEIARLYQDCVNLLMQKWRPTAATSLMTALGVRDVDLDQMLEQIAYDAHSKQAERQGAADIPEHEIVGIARARLGGDLHKAGIFCDYIEKQAGLLIGRGQTAAGWRVFSFPHRTFQEFLAGRWAANNDFPEIAPELADRGANWREALLLATGHLVFNQGQTTLALSAVDSLCPADDAPQTELDWQKVWLAGDMLKLIGLERAEATRKGPGLIKRVRQRLVDLIEGGHLHPVERAGAGRALSVVGDPRPGVSLRPDGLPDIAWADEIPAGNYWIGSDKERDNNPRCPTSIYKSYRVSKYPVTQAQYQIFKNDASEKGYSCSQWWNGLDYDFNKDRPPKPYFYYANHPMESLNWYQAVAFCNWLTWHLRQVGLITPGEVIRLPHEYEWEVAARGIEERVYSYAGDFDPTKANTGATGIRQTSAVGLFPGGASPCGALDMTGNIGEWCLNRLDSKGSNSCVVRGGSFSEGGIPTRAPFRFGLDRHVRNYDLGFRVVRVSLSQGI